MGTLPNLNDHDDVYLSCSGERGAPNLISKKENDVSYRIIIVYGSASLGTALEE